MSLKEIANKLKEANFFAVVNGEEITGALSSEYDSSTKMNILKKAFWITVDKNEILVRYLFYQLEQKKIFTSIDSLLLFLKTELKTIP